MAVPSPNPNKQAVRKSALALRKKYVSQLAPDTRRALEEQLAERLAPIIAGAQVIAAYAACGSEISADPIVQRARRLGKTVAFPFFESANDTLFTFRDGAAEHSGPFGIRQPAEDAPIVIPDLVLLPLVAVDEDGNRLGRGKGHFDRALAQLPGKTLRVGLGWKAQLLPRLPRDDWDVRMHMFANPRDLMEFDA